MYEFFVLGVLDGLPPGFWADWFLFYFYFYMSIGRDRAVEDADGSLLLPGYISLSLLRLGSASFCLGKPVLRKRSRWAHFLTGGTFTPFT